MHTTIATALLDHIKVRDIHSSTDETLTMFWISNDYLHRFFAAVTFLRLPIV